MAPVIYTAPSRSYHLTDGVAELFRKRPRDAIRTGRAICEIATHMGGVKDPAIHKAAVMFGDAKKILGMPAAYANGIELLKKSACAIAEGAGKGGKNYRAVVIASGRWIADVNDSLKATQTMGMTRLTPHTMHYIQVFEFCCLLSSMLCNLWDHKKKIEQKESELLAKNAELEQLSQTPPVEGSTENRDRLQSQGQIIAAEIQNTWIAVAHHTSYLILSILGLLLTVSGFVLHPWAMLVTADTALVTGMVRFVHEDWIAFQRSALGKLKAS